VSTICRPKWGPIVVVVVVGGDVVVVIVVVLAVVGIRATRAVVVVGCTAERRFKSNKKTEKEKEKEKEQLCAWEITW
jgi:hypothetical protein